MTSEILLDCAQSFNSIIGTQYIIHLGRAGKHKIFRITIDKEDAHHLMGLHYLLDYPDRRNRAKIFDDILQSKKYREHLASSDYWNKDLETRITCTSLLSAILDDNGTIFHYNPKRLTFYSKIKADYLIAQENYHLSDEVFSDIYLFIDKRSHSEDHFCKSIFPKSLRDYTHNQTIWHLLYKEKISPDGTSTILFKHLNYDPNDSN